MLPLGALALLAAGWGGLARSGVLAALPAGGSGTPHGALMVSGFVGTLIALERVFVGTLASSLHRRRAATLRALAAAHRA